MWCVCVSVSVCVSMCVSVCPSLLKEAIVSDTPRHRIKGSTLFQWLRDEESRRKLG